MSWLQSFLYDERNPRKLLMVASVVMQCDREPEANRARMADRIETIIREHPEVDLIFFGEAILGWYDPAGNPGDHRRRAEPIPGKTTQMLAELASAHKVYISFGMSESSYGDLYNSQVLIDPLGAIQAVHRKRNLKEATYQPGTEPLTITDIKGVRTGIVICSDAASPNTMWALVNARLELILLSLADDRDEGFFMAKANARLYDAWIVTANRYGNEAGHYWNGHMVISDPLGRLRVAVQEKEQTLVYALQFAGRQSAFKRALRTSLVKLPLGFHILRNWKLARSYF